MSEESRRYLSRRAWEFGAGATALRQISYLFIPPEGEERPEATHIGEAAKGALQLLELPPGERLVTRVRGIPGLHYALACLADLLDREADRLAEEAERKS